MSAYLDTKLRTLRIALSSEAEDLVCDSHDYCSQFHTHQYHSGPTGHVHSLIWLEGAPKFGDDGFYEFVDRNTTCSLDTPLKNLVLKYQSHIHTPTCFKRNTSHCRFNFPKQVQLDTTVTSDADALETRGRTVLLRRGPTEAYINNYHPVLLKAVQSNMDIQVFHLRTDNVARI